MCLHLPKLKGLHLPSALSTQTDLLGGALSKSYFKECRRGKKIFPWRKYLCQQYKAGAVLRGWQDPFSCLAAAEHYPSTVATTSSPVVSPEHLAAWSRGLESQQNKKFPRPWKWIYNWFYHTGKRNRCVWTFWLSSKTPGLMFLKYLRERP